MKSRLKIIASCVAAVSLILLTSCNFEVTTASLKPRIVLTNIRGGKNVFKSSNGEEISFAASGMKVMTNKTYKNAVLKNREILEGIETITIKKLDDKNAINDIELLGGYEVEGIIEYSSVINTSFVDNTASCAFNKASGYPNYFKLTFKSEISISKISIIYSNVSTAPTGVSDSRLPFVVIDTNEKGVTTKEYVDTTVKITNTNSSNSLDESTAQMKVRGNSTANYEKKPYRIKFDKKQKVFGKTKNKSWVLLADYLDPSSLHNYTAFKLTNYFDRTAYSPLAQHVRVYMDGEYKGLYLMTEHPDEKEGRANVLLDFNEDLTEFAYTMELDQTANQDPDIEAYFPFMLTGGTTRFYLALKSPEKDDFLEYYQEIDESTAETQTEIAWNAFLEYLESQIDDIKAGLESNNFTAMNDLFDQDSFVDYMLIDQIMGEKDHYNKSFKFYRRLGEKIKFGPIWDYDFVMHTPWTGLPNDHPGINQCYFSNIFMQKYFAITQNKQALADRWYDIGEDSIFELREHLLEYAETLGSELYKDADLWYSGNHALVDRNIVYITDYIYNQIPIIDAYYNSYR